MGTDVFYRRGFDHLKTIARTLQNLRGAGALAYELIQNADDAEGARNLTFRFCGDALEVIDDGGFESCGRLKDEMCAWEVQRRGRNSKKRCDFHAFQQLAGASKGDDPDLTGAFGVGFLSVYQVTDRPELISGGQHWIIDESRIETERIRGCGGCDEPHDATGTRFRLPWATHATPFRQQLESDPITATARERLYHEFVTAIPAAMVFLHKLDTITVEHPRRRPRTYRREVTADGVTIHGPDRTERWVILEDSFGDVAHDLRAKHPQIGQRRPVVRVAVQPGASVKGRLHATLPTQILTGLPVHVDASFFPRLDRKGILLEGHEGDWNRAAVECAARLVAHRLEDLADHLGAKAFWRLVRAAYEGRNRERRGAKDSLGVFWAEIRRELPDARVMPTTSGESVAVNEAILPARGDSPDWLALLEDLGIHMVAEPLRRLVGDMRRAIPTAELALGRLVEALRDAGLGEGPITPRDLPVGLTSAKRRNALRRHLASLVAADAEAHRDEVRSLALWRTTRRTYDSLTASYLVRRDTARLFGPVIEYPLIDRDAQDDACLALLDLGDSWESSDGVTALAQDDTVLPRNEEDARLILDWLTCRLEELDQSEFRRLSERPLVPTRHGLLAPALCVEPGGFDDPLDLAGEVIAEVASAYRPALRALGVQELTFAQYVCTFVPRVTESNVTVPQLLKFVNVCVDRRRDVDGDRRVREVLAHSAWVPCTDGERREPASVYFGTDVVCRLLGDTVSYVHSSISATGGGADLLRALGARDEPRADDVIALVREIVVDPPDAARVDQVLSVLRYLQTTRQDVGPDGPFASLHELEWIPAGEHPAWSVPSDVFLTRDRALFATTGLFVALPRKEQDELRTVLNGLGLRQTPSVALVVGHVVQLLDAGEPLEPRIAHWLNSDRHWTDDAIESLRDTEWLATTSGVLAAPSAVFLHEHDLAPDLATLHPSLRGFTDLLDALGVRPEPGTEDALQLLTEISENGKTTAPLLPERRKIVRACWRRLARDSDAALDVLAARTVVLGNDDRLYRPSDVLLNDVPSIARTFDESVGSRLIGQSDSHSALRRAGVRELSTCLRSRIVDRGQEVDGTRVAERILKRQPQLARVVGAEGGRWSAVLELASSLRVEAYDWFNVAHYLVGWDHVPATSPVAAGAHWLGDGTLVVVVKAGRADWFEIAYCLREVLCPNASPAVATAIEGLLAADTGKLAHERVSRLKYPELDPDHWAELAQVLEEQHRRARLRDDDDRRPADSGTGAEDNIDSQPADDHTSTHDQTSPVGNGDERVAHDRAEPAQDSAGAGAAGAAAGTTDEAEFTADIAESNFDSASGTPAPLTQTNGQPTGSPSGRANPGSGAAEKPQGRRARERRRKARGASEWWYAILSASKPADTDSEVDIDAIRAAGRRSAIDLAGMAAVERHEAEAGRHPHAQPPNNPGFDIDSLHAGGETARLIEVKSLAGAWGPDGFPKLTPTQWDLALTARDTYWLYVVEFAESDDPVITRIQDPAGIVTRYVVDPGWRALGEPDQPPTVSLPGAIALP